MLRPGVEENRMLQAEGAEGLQLPAGCELLSKLYANHGVRIRMVRRNRQREKIPTVRQLIERLAKKHDQLLASEMDATSKRLISSSSTPVIQFPNSDSICGSDILRHQSQNDNFQSGDLLSYERDRQKLKEVDLGNKRPSSRHSTSKKAGNFDKAAIFDRDRDELRPLASSLPSTKQLPIRANGIKNNLLRGDAFLGQRNNPPSGREEDIVAMGTLWSPGQLQNRSSISIASNKSNNSGFNNSIVASTTFPLKRSVNAPTNISSRQLSNNNAVFPSSSLSSTGTGNIFRNSPKEVEPKYTDPLAGAPPSFQQRLMELASLEAETVRWERAKKVKKKTKQDRDS